MFSGGIEKEYLSEMEYPFKCQPHKMVKHTPTIAWVCLTISGGWRLKGQ